jgi:flagellar basal body-associated protein FliL
MSKDVINVGGEERVVREDTAKAYRGTVWILTVVGIVVVTAAILFFAFFGTSMFNTDLQSPKTIEEKSQ